jgi:hypothetical protein
MSCARCPLTGAALALALKLWIGSDLITNGATGATAANLASHAYLPINTRLLALNPAGDSSA